MVGANGTFTLTRAGVPGSRNKANTDIETGLGVGARKVKSCQTDVWQSRTRVPFATEEHESSA